MERIGLLLMIVLGESVVQIVNALDVEERVPMHWVTAALAMTLLCALWWLVYDATVSKIETAMDRDDTTVADFVGGSQLAIVAGLVLMGAGMSDAIHAAHPEGGAAHLHAGSLACLCLGLLLVSVGAQSLSRRAFAANLGIPLPSQRPRERGTQASAQPATRRPRGWERGKPSVATILAALGKTLVFLLPIVLVWVFGAHWAPWLVLGALLAYVVATVAMQALGARRLAGFVETGGLVGHTDSDGATTLGAVLAQQRANTEGP